MPRLIARVAVPSQKKPLQYILLAPEYPGYSANEYEKITPTETNAKEACYAACMHLLNQYNHQSITKIILIGRSIGSGVALWLANQPGIKNKLYGIILVSPFASVGDLATDHCAPGAVVIPSDAFPNTTEIQHISTKTHVLILHGTQDTVILPRHSQLLYKAFKGSFKSLVLVPGAHHDDLEFRILKPMADFIMKATPLVPVQ
jgi:pimeloyl-ACP methyl ester carboxylesterase